MVVKEVDYFYHKIGLNYTIFLFKLTYFLFTAEFIIDIADKNPTFDCFKKALVENGAEFSDSFMTNLLRIIQHMKPVNNPSQKGETSIESNNPLANKFPGLAIPNEKPPHFSSDEDSEEEKVEKVEKDEKEEKKTKRLTSKDIFKDEAKNKTNDAIVDQAMAELEALAPSHVTSIKEPVKEPLKKEIIKEEIKKRERSCSRDRKDSSKRRDRSRDRRERSRDRRDVKRRRSKSRDRRSRSRDRRSRSRDRDRDRRRRSRSRPTSSRHRSRDRHRRSRSRGKRSPSREREREDRYVDYKKPKKRSPEVEMSDDPEPGKVSPQ